MQKTIQSSLRSHVLLPKLNDRLQHLSFANAKHILIICRTKHLLAKISIVSYLKSVGALQYVLCLGIIGKVAKEYKQSVPSQLTFRDIFSPGPRTSGPLTYNGTWNPNGPATQGHSRADSLYCQSTLHPPMVLQPPSDLS